MEEWMNDELVRDIPVQKLEFLAQMFSQNRGIDQKHTIRSILPLLKEAREKGYTFTPAETSAVISAIRKYSSKEENQKIDALLNRVMPK